MNILRLGYNISNELHKRNMSYRELGRRINKQHATVADHVFHPHRITVKELMEIGGTFGIDWMDLLKGVEDDF